MNKHLVTLCLLLVGCGPAPEVEPQPCSPVDAGVMEADAGEVDAGPPAPYAEQCATLCGAKNVLVSFTVDAQTGAVSCVCEPR